jgi:hypothetical protein
MATSASWDFFSSAAHFYRFVAQYVTHSFIVSSSSNNTQHYHRLFFPYVNSESAAAVAAAAGAGAGYNNGSVSSLALSSIINHSMLLPQQRFP